jgi:uncharacterized membrane-anchored protein
MQRRSFVKKSIYAVMVAATGLRRVLADADRKRILVLGGTHFLGPAVVHAALADGHAVTLQISIQKAFATGWETRPFRNTAIDYLTYIASYLQMAPILTALLWFCIEMPRGGKTQCSDLA